MGNVDGKITVAMASGRGIGRQGETSSSPHQGVAVDDRIFRRSTRRCTRRSR
jgi:hypothetical protein